MPNTRLLLPLLLAVDTGPETKSVRQHYYSLNVGAKAKYSGEFGIVIAFSNESEIVSIFSQKYMYPVTTKEKVS